jgi:hypothetical protein
MLFSLSDATDADNVATDADDVTTDDDEVTMEASPAVPPEWSKALSPLNTLKVKRVRVNVFQNDFKMIFT